MPGYKILSYVYTHLKYRLQNLCITREALKSNEYLHSPLPYTYGNLKFYMPRLIKSKTGLTESRYMGFYKSSTVTVVLVPYI